MRIRRQTVTTRLQERLLQGRRRIGLRLQGEVQDNGRIVEGY